MGKEYLRMLIFEEKKEDKKWDDDKFKWYKTPVRGTIDLKLSYI